MCETFLVSHGWLIRVIRHPLLIGYVKQATIGDLVERSGCSPFWGIDGTVDMQDLGSCARA